MEIHHKSICLKKKGDSLPDNCVITFTGIHNQLVTVFKQIDIPAEGVDDLIKSCAVAADSDSALGSCRIVV